MKSLLLILTLVIFWVPSYSQNTLDNAGLTGATTSSAAFSLRKLSSSYAGSAIKVRRSSDNAEANLAFDVNGYVTASSLVTFTPGVVVGSFGTVQTGTITADAAKTGIKPFRRLNRVP